MSDTYEPSLRPLRLIMRHFSQSDLPTLLAYRNDLKVARYQGWSSLTVAEAKAFVEAQRIQPVAVPHAWLQIALELKSTGRHIGDLALNVDGQRQAELGYLLDRAFRPRLRCGGGRRPCELRLHAPQAAPDGRAARRGPSGVGQGGGAHRGSGGGALRRELL